jgi:hypothetical protein
MKKPRPHNPDNLTKKQIGRAPWRLLDEDEIKTRPSTLHIEAWLCDDNGDDHWTEWPWIGSLADTTYRTRLTRAQLRRLK